MKFISFLGNVLQQHSKGWSIEGNEKETYGSILPLSHVFLCGCEIHFLFSGNVLQQQSKGFVIGEEFCLDSAFVGCCFKLPDNEARSCRAIL